MGQIMITCQCESNNMMHVRTVEAGIGMYEHVFICKDCETTSVFRLTQIMQIPQKEKLLE